MGVTNGRLAVLTSRCLIDYKYPNHNEADPRFANLALFDSEGRQPRTVFMLAPILERPDMGLVRDPRGAHILMSNRLYLEGGAGDRYFGGLATNSVPRVGVELVKGQWESNQGIDLVMLYFPLNDPAVQVLRPDASLGAADPIGIVRAAMEGRTEYLQTFSFSMITDSCLHQVEAETAHLEHEVRLWKGIAIVAAAAAILPLLGPLLAAEGGLVGFAGEMLVAIEHAVGPRILAGLPEVAWKITQRTLSGQDLADVVWDEGGHLVISSVIDGFPRRISVAGVRRGSASNEIANRVLATTREFVRDRAGQLLIQYGNGHVDVGSLMRPDVGADLSTELLSSGLVALDVDDRQTLARQPTLVRAAASALMGARGPAVLDPAYQGAVQQLAAITGT